MRTTTTKHIRSALDALIAERDVLTRQIQTLEQVTASLGIQPPTKKTTEWTEAKRKAVSIRMKKYWAARKKDPPK